MGVMSEMDAVQREQGEIAPFTLSSDANEIPAPAAGTVDTIQVTVGAAVKAGELLATLK